MIRRPDQNWASLLAGADSAAIPDSMDNAAARALRPLAHAIVTEHWADVYRLMYRLTGNTHDAEELTQEGILRAIQKLSQFQPGTNLRGWLLRIATNAFLDLQRRRRTLRIEEVTHDPAHDGPSIHAAMENDELGAQLQAAIVRLPENQRTVFLLRTTEDMAFREIAETIGVTEVTARWHMLQARQQLMKLLEGKL